MTEERLLPAHIFTYLSGLVLGQEAVLRQVAVAIYKHLNRVAGGNLLLIGNSGTGKTTLMKAIRQFYADHPHLSRFRVMAVLNANTLVDEAGEVKLSRLFRPLEIEARLLLGDQASPAELADAMTHATVCLDEVDKISARVADRVSVTGLTIQQALLTVLEGERVPYDLTGEANSARVPLDTSRMHFLCGGAFEELYDQVYTLMEQQRDDRRLREVNVWNEKEGRVLVRIAFNLKDNLRLADLFAYGMVPQFISRFSAVAILEDLGAVELRQILLTAADSPLRHSQQYFDSLGITLQVEDAALTLIAQHAARQTRIGARALRESFSRLVAELEYDPWGSGLLRQDGDRPTLTIDAPLVEARLPS